jgi:hypothetical protein
MLLITRSICIYRSGMTLRITSLPVYIIAWLHGDPLQTLFIIKIWMSFRRFSKID